MFRILNAGAAVCRHFDLIEKPIPPNIYGGRVGMVPPIYHTCWLSLPLFNYSNVVLRYIEVLYILSYLKVVLFYATAIEHDNRHLRSYIKS